MVTVFKKRGFIVTKGAQSCAMTAPQIVTVIVVKAVKLNEIRSEMTTRCSSVFQKFYFVTL
jgi:hypothetical protein